MFIYLQRCHDRVAYCDFPIQYLWLAMIIIEFVKQQQQELNPAFFEQFALGQLLRYYALGQLLMYYAVGLW